MRREPPRRPTSTQRKLATIPVCVAPREFFDRVSRCPHDTQAGISNRMGINGCKSRSSRITDGRASHCRSQGDNRYSQEHQLDSSVRIPIRSSQIPLGMNEGGSTTIHPSMTTSSDSLPPTLECEQERGASQEPDKRARLRHCLRRGCTNRDRLVEIDIGKREELILNGD